MRTVCVHRERPDWPGFAKGTNRFSAWAGFPISFLPARIHPFCFSIRKQAYMHIEVMITYCKSYGRKGNRPMIVPIVTTCCDRGLLCDFPSEEKRTVRFIKKQEFPVSGLRNNQRSSRHISDAGNYSGPRTEAQARV